MTKTSYSEKLKNPLWQKRRLEVFQRDNWHCQYCNDGESTLHVHHKSYSGNPWEAPLDQLITVCEHCHLIIESNKDVAITVIHRIKHFADCFTCLAICEKGLLIYFCKDKNMKLLIKMANSSMEDMNTFLNKIIKSKIL